MLVLSGAEVEPLLDPDLLLEAVSAAMADLSAGRASMPNRVAAAIPDLEAFLGAMPAYLPSSGALTTKLVAVFPRNTDRPTHQAVLVCFEAATGSPVALMDATAITAERTAAGSALAARLLAREDARTLAVLGTGVQADAHVRAVTRVRAFERVVLVGRERGRAESLARSLETRIGPAIEVADTYEEAVRSADVVCATTHATEPVVHREWLAPGTHISSVGFNPAGLGEVDAETVRDAAVFVESRASALAPPPAGAVELLRPIADGVIGPDHVRAEIGEVVLGTAPGRASAGEITLYKSVGVAVQDAAAAALVLAAAREQGIGTDVVV
jgi:ornithine cyclodeaminase